ncbi:hypothetical protein L873DRAFT_1827131 [Choiromyces venosus 120613-1]|uniref:DUF6536 domain-containing protein n=1 Tax=Choiromyces venosus 120613-1 TaxID=1336337 RepID=A0A3N4K0D4_9PEZI|nr:hypothetical protein L873DRAFT_1827131 [Choiromyces venosus 120613-1]
MFQGRQESKRRGSNASIELYQKVPADGRGDAGGSRSWRDDDESKVFLKTQKKGLREDGGSDSDDFEAQSPPSSSLYPSQKLSTTRSRLSTPSSRFSILKGLVAAVLIAATAFLFTPGVTIYCIVVYPPENAGLGTLYLGDCDDMKKISFWAHVAINFVSSILLSGSHYTQQVLSAPTRKEIDAAHETKDWLDIGIPSFRNLRAVGHLHRMERIRVWVWWTLGFTSIPMHLLFNSAIFSTLSLNNYYVGIVTPEFFNGTSYNQTGHVISGLQAGIMGSVIVEPFVEGFNYTFWNPNKPGERYVGHYTYGTESILTGNIQIEGYFYNTTNSSDSVAEKIMAEMQDGWMPDYNFDEEGGIWHKMDTKECRAKYSQALLGDMQNLVLVSSTKPKGNSSLMSMIMYNSLEHKHFWMCQNESSLIDIDNWNKTNYAFPKSCEMGDGNGVKDIPDGDWVVRGHTITECRGQGTRGECRLQFSVGILTVVIIANLLKAISMALAAFRIKTVLLVFMGDAIESFLKEPDITTSRRCLADKTMAESSWELQPAPKPYAVKQWRWWHAPSKRRWFITVGTWVGIISLSAIFIGTGYTKDERNGMGTDIKSLVKRGFGAQTTSSVLSSRDGGLLIPIFLANSPQVALSFLYLTYNGIFTSMFMAKEWMDFAIRRKPLRVSQPTGKQRSTYWLQLPYRYSLPLMAPKSVTHLCASQGIFLAKFEIFNPLGKSFKVISTVGYPVVGITLLMASGLIHLIVLFAVGLKKYPLRMPLAASSSAAIAAAYHPPEDDIDALYEPLMWGAVPTMSSATTEPEVGHCSLSSLPVEQPIIGHLYAGKDKDV